MLSSSLDDSVCGYDPALGCRISPTLDAPIDVVVTPSVCSGDRPSIDHRFHNNHPGPPGDAAVCVY
jgi:hypothetical protein